MTLVLCLAFTENNMFDQHAGFGLSVDGTIDTSFTRKCSNCSSPYCRKVLLCVMVEKAYKMCFCYYCSKVM